eukprot:GHRQ01023276.1.p2 GENE.GHRQ01023276.1~~GHRQ01023276.1.p2  ORF type:complete len:102 (-),score=8.91 GHRQ01023276.1:313-618(-)
MAECYGWQDLLNFAGRAGNFYPGQCDYFGGGTVLPQAIGWVIVVAFGAGKSLAQRSRQRSARAALFCTRAIDEARSGLISPCKLFARLKTLPKAMVDAIHL